MLGQVQVLSPAIVTTMPTQGAFVRLHFIFTSGGGRRAKMWPLSKCAKFFSNGQIVQRRPCPGRRPAPLAPRDWFSRRGPALGILAVGCLRRSLAIGALHRRGPVVVKLLHRGDQAPGRPVDQPSPSLPRRSLRPLDAIASIHARTGRRSPPPRIPRWTGFPGAIMPMAHWCCS